jgi:hypothetical protein
MALRFGATEQQAFDWFFHIPRTGGNFAIRSLTQMNLKGEPVYARHKGHAHGSPLKFRVHDVRRGFCIVRPPLDWYRSFYRFRIVKHYVKANMEPGHPLDQFIWHGRYRNGGGIYNFDSFVKKVQHEYPDGYLTELYFKFIRYVDMVLSTDRIATELPVLMTTWGYDAPVWVPDGKKNNTTNKHGAWVTPKNFVKWTKHNPIPALPVEISPTTVELMEEREACIIAWLRDRRIL